MMLRALRALPRRAAPARERGSAAFVLCSLFLLAGAAAGCFAASFTPAGEEGGLFAAWRLPFGTLLGYRLIPAAGAALLSCSCLGCLLLPPLTGAAGFFAAFILCAARRLGGVPAPLLWTAGAWLPCWLLLAAAGTRLSLALLRALGTGARPVPGVGRFFAASLALYAAAAAALCGTLAY